MEPLNQKPLRPPRLMPGGTIGIVAPAGSFDQKIFSQGLNILRSMGFQILVPDEIFEKTGYLAGSDAQRAQLINRLFQDPVVNAIFCARGGYGSLRILPLLDFDAIRKNPKIFMGYSDITSLLVSITAKCGLASFHGPVVTTLVKANELTRNSLLAAITSDTHLEIVPAAGVTLRAGSVNGPVVGGNLTTLCHLLGTPFEPKFKNHILLLEDRGEAHYRIDRMLFQMKLAGSFEGIAGLALGSFEDCESLDGVYRIFEEHFRDIPVPILAGFDVGHGQQNLTIPFGIDAVLDADKQILLFDQPATTG